MIHRAGPLIDGVQRCTLCGYAAAGDGGVTHFHGDNCYAIGPGDTEALICKWKSEGGMFSRREAAEELATLSNTASGSPRCPKCRDGRHAELRRRPPS
jgi:hypothetical protein